DLNPFVHPLQKIIGVIGVVLPGILTIENNRDYPAISSQSGLDCDQAPAQVCHCAPRLPLRVGKTDQVGDLVITEERADLTGTATEAPGSVQPLLTGAKAAVHAFFQNLLIGGNPADAALGNDRQRLIADGTL